MKGFLLDLLICPACLPAEVPLQAIDLVEQQRDIVSGRLICRGCATSYPIRQGVAMLTSAPQPAAPGPSKYESAPVLSSYLWSHYGDLLPDPQACRAYRQWAELLRPDSGLAIDIGAAVGRFSFELARHKARVIGIDNSYAFVKTARELLMTGRKEVDLVEEGRLTRKVAITLPPDWPTEQIEFIVADALALPFRRNTVATLASLNLIDKVPKPLQHLTELNRVARQQGAQLLLSDPFSWSPEVAAEDDWLGGTDRGRHSGRAMDNLQSLLQGHGGHLLPPWKVQRSGHVWWKIRTHANHFELIRSCYIKADREGRSMP